MQSVISSLAWTFVDDAIALVNGLGAVAWDLAASGIGAGQRKFMAPIVRLARACDVAGILTADGARRLPAHPTPASRRGGRFDVFGLFATLRALRDLT
jgi:hypothetical protein